MAFPTPVTLSVGDILSLEEAATLAGVSVSTVRRYAIRFGIGRQLTGGMKWRISGPAIRMVIALDVEALEMFRAGSFDSPLVAQYVAGSPRLSSSDD